MIYKCKHFCIEEFVPPAVYEARGEKAWELMDNRILEVADNLRDRYGSATINSWKWGGDRLWSGLRTADSPYYSPYSQHTFGRAVDIIFRDVSAEEVRQDILRYCDATHYKLITSLELDVSWLHVDVRNCDRIKAFKP